MTDSPTDPSAGLLQGRLFDVATFVVATDNDGLVIDANAHALGSRKLAAGDVAGRPLESCGWFVSDSAARLRDALQRAARGEVVRRDIELVDEGGHASRHEFTFVPRRAADGRQDAIIVTGVDVGVREKPHDERNLQFLQDLFEYAPDAIIMVTLGGEIRLLNRTAEELFGYSREEAIGESIERLIPEHDEVSQAPSRRGAAATAAARRRYRGCRRDGTEFPAEVRHRPVDTEQGPMIAVSVRDDTERNRLEVKLQQSLRMETVGRLAGGVAHDFNNVLTVINATAELLLDRIGDDASMREDVGTILRAGEQAATVTRQLLALSRQQLLKPVIIDLNQALSDIEPLLVRLIGENIALKIRTAADRVTARADRGQLDQVILNLAMNARDAMPDGGTLLLEARNVRLAEADAAAHEDLEPGSYAVLAVSDTGGGIDEATRRRLFEPFFTTKAAGQGTGLGLSTVYGIVSQSGGGMSVSTEAGKGSTFSVYLPRVDANAADRAEPVAASGAGSETVLVVEDEPEIRQVAAIMLERRGYTVLAAASADEAEELVRSLDGKLDLVLSDVVMPDASGPEAVRRIRELAPDVRVLYMSGYAADLIERHGIDNDARHFLAKPFTLAELTGAVRNVLDD